MYAYAVSLEGQSQSGGFTDELRKRLRDGLGHAFDFLRGLEAFERLPIGPWAVFGYVVARLGMHDDCYPSQVRIAEKVGGKVDTDAERENRARAVRKWTATLRDGGFLSVVRESYRNARGEARTRLRYSPGPTTIAGLEAFVERYPRGDDDRPRAKYLRPMTLRKRPDPGSGGLPDPRSAEPESSESLTFSSPESSSSPALADVAASSSPLPPPAAPEQEEAAIAGSLRRMALEALTQRFTRACPDVAPPAWDPAVVAQVVSCLEALPGTHAERAQASRDAVDGAFSSSKGPPSPRYVWGDRECFARHWRTGRAMRLEAAAVRARPARARPPADESPPMTPDEMKAAAAAAARMLDGLT